MNAATGNSPMQPTAATNLETLYRTHSARLAGYTAARLGTQHLDLVDDVLGEVWLQATERAAVGELPDSDEAFDILRRLVVASAARHTLPHVEDPVGMLLPAGRGLSPAPAPRSADPVVVRSPIAARRAAKRTIAA